MNNPPIDEVKTIFAFFFSNPLFDEALRQLKRFKNIHFVVATHEIERDFRNWSALTYSGIVPKHVDIPTLDISDVIRIQAIEFLDVAFLVATSIDPSTERDPHSSVQGQVPVLFEVNSEAVWE